jgi:hypothetical protein
MALLSWTWWAESVLSVGLALAVLMMFPSISLPRELDPQGALRQVVASKLPSARLRQHWMH